MEEKNMQGSTTETNYGSENPYGAGDARYYDQFLKQQAKQSEKKNKVPGMIVLVIGIIFLLAGIGIIFVGGQTSKMEVGEPIDVYYATATDQYTYALVQYMTEPVAYYEAMENMQFYIVYDADWNPAVICLHTDDLETFQPYIDWFYSDSYENEPEQLMITGYAQPFDAELEEFVEEGFVFDWGEEIMEESTIEDWFGSYYLQVGEKNGAYQFSNVGIYLLLAAVILIVIGGAMIYEKPVIMKQNGLVVKSGSTLLGLLGALFGAVLGGLAWAVIGALGYYSGWIGILMVFFAYKGYAILSHKEDRLGLVISFIFAAAIIIPATFLSYGWSYYGVINESVSGYTSLVRALLELPAYMDIVDGWSNFWTDVAVGYVCVLLASMYFLFSDIGKKRK